MANRIDESSQSLGRKYSGLFDQVPFRSGSRNFWNFGVDEIFKSQDAASSDFTVTCNFERYDRDRVVTDLSRHSRAVLKSVQVPRRNNVRLCVTWGTRERDANALSLNQPCAAR